MEKLIVRFWLRKQQLNKDGLAPLYYYIRVGGKKGKDIATGIFVKECDWNSKLQTVINNNDAVAKMEKIKENIKTESVLMERKGEKKTVQSLSAKVKIKSAPAKKLTVLCQEYFEYQKNVEVVSPNTLRTYRIRYNQLIKYLKHNRIEEIKAEDFTNANGYLLYSYAIKQNCCNNYAMKIVQFVKQANTWAVSMGLLEKNPIENFDFKYDEPGAPIWLNQAEREKLITLPLSNQRLKQVRDVFLFMCYTGLAWADIDSFRPEKHLQKVDGVWCLKKERVKTKSVFFVPLRPKAIAILHEYIGEDITRPVKLPVLCNQKFNQYLKALADMAGLDKKLSTHVARKTFGNMLINEEGIDVFSVSYMFGHKSVKQTMKEYVKISDYKVLRDMQNLISSEQQHLVAS